MILLRFEEPELDEMPDGVEHVPLGQIAGLTGVAPLDGHGDGAMLRHHLIVPGRPRPGKPEQGSDVGL